MKNETLVLIVVATLIAIFTYLNLVATEYKPVESNVSTSTYTPEKVRPNEIPELSDLSAEEDAVTDSLFKSYVKQAETESKTKSIETMRDEVHKILDEIVETDSTVTITFNMTTTNPLISYEKEEY
tara:strand:+ start:113 stop:490 length:378 start_codon:yes stop_codon:yes gene_type:complete